ncbi:MAG: hypothetical protein ACLU9S_20455 [Oscillospiraceae bacterium]
MGRQGHELTLSDYTMDIQLDYNALPNANSLAGEILDMLLAVRPCNMRVLMTAFLQSYGDHLPRGIYGTVQLYGNLAPHRQRAGEHRRRGDRGPAGIQHSP